jgi:molybdopterin synthase catalytic subunit
MAHSFLTTDPLDMSALLDLVRGPSNGAYVTFTGDVRDNDNGAAVSEIDYVAYDQLARKELTRIGQSAESKWPGCSCAVAHRTGVLKVGETSVAIAVAASHRAEAFDVCRWIIDTLKTDLPIWKREEFAGGSRVWIEGPDRVAIKESEAMKP